MESGLQGGVTLSGDTSDHPAFPGYRWRSKGPSPSSPVTSKDPTPMQVSLES